MDSRELLETARVVSQKAYAPYSCFRVGAAILAEDGSVHTSCNVENASYGLSVCAERNAVAAMICGTEARRIIKVAVSSPDAAPCMPCGACRQVLREFGCEEVVVEDDSGTIEYTMEEILPHSFGPESL